MQRSTGSSDAAGSQAQSTGQDNGNQNVDGQNSNGQNSNGQNSNGRSSNGQDSNVQSSTPQTSDLQTSDSSGESSGVEVAQMQEQLDHIRDAHGQLLNVLNALRSLPEAEAQELLSRLRASYDVSELLVSLGRGQQQQRPENEDGDRPSA